MKDLDTDKNDNQEDTARTDKCKCGSRRSVWVELGGLIEDYNLYCKDCGEFIRSWRP